MKYIYSKRRDEVLHKHKIVRETDATYWIITGSSEQKISKKKMSGGSVWDTFSYYEPTEELDKQFSDQEYRYSIHSQFIKLINSITGIRDTSLQLKIIELCKDITL